MHLDPGQEGTKLTARHLLHAEALELTIEFIDLGLLGLFHNLIRNIHIGKSLQQLNFLLELSIGSQDRRPVTAKDIGNDREISVAKIFNSRRITSVIPRVCKFRCSNELSELLQNRKSYLKGPVAQLAQRQFLSIIRHQRHGALEIFWIENEIMTVP